MHVVRLVRIVGDQRVELHVLARRRIGRRGEGGPIGIRLRQERQQVTRILEARRLVRRHEVRDAGLRRMRRRAAELLERDLFSGDRLHDVGTGDEHVRGALDHEDEVGHRGRVDGTAGARAHDQRDLRDHPARLDVAPEDLRVSGERDDAFLDPRAAGVVDPDHRTAVLHGQVHHLADLLGEDLAERAAENREVLREKKDPAAENAAVSRDDGVAVRATIHHPEVRFAVADVAVELDERARVAQLLGTLAGEELPLFAPARDGLLAARVESLSSQLLQPLELPRGRLVRLAHRRGA